VYSAAGADNYHYSYSAWGTPTGKATITNGQTSPYGYTGQYKDQYLPDRLQLRARSYDATQRRFTTQDPIGSAADNPNQSAYNYADNDPGNLADPSGNCPMCIGAAIGAVVSGGVYALSHQDDFDWGDFAAATGEGAVVGAVGGFFAPAGTSLATQLGLQGGRALAVATVTDAAIGAGLTWAINTAQCQPTTPGDLLVGALTGGLGNLIRPAWAWGRNLFRGVKLSHPSAGIAQPLLGMQPARTDGVVLHGHGGYYGHGTFEVPEGTSVYMYVKDGRRLDAKIGLIISAGNGRIEPVQIYGPGQTIPNYTLSPLGRHPETGWPMKYRVGSRVVDDDTLLSDLLEPNMGVCHWVACRRPGAGNG
jgi:RHS repeat-associated protein